MITVKANHHTFEAITVVKLLSLPYSELPEWFDDALKEGDFSMRGKQLFYSNGNPLANSDVIVVPSSGNQRRWAVYNCEDFRDSFSEISSGYDPTRDAMIDALWGLLTPDCGPAIWRVIVKTLAANPSLIDVDHDDVEKELGWWSGAAQQMEKKGDDAT